MSEPSKIVAVLLGLFVWCSLYALILDQPPVRRWYHPDRLWLTVVIGDGWIVIACAVMERLGIDLTSGLLLLACVAAGIPIVLWQLIQHGRNEGARTEIVNGGGHGDDAWGG